MVFYIKTQRWAMFKKSKIAQIYNPCTNGSILVSSER
jgi:hypothetical protein